MSEDNGKTQLEQLNISIVQTEVADGGTSLTLIGVAAPAAAELSVEINTDLDPRTLAGFLSNLGERITQKIDADTPIELDGGYDDPEAAR